MKKKILICVATVLVGVGLYAASGYYGSPDRMSDYRIRNNQYAIVYVNTNNESDHSVDKKTMTRAAKLTKNKGYRYFKIDDERDVYVAKSPSSTSRYPRNKYQETIVEKNFGREQTAPSRQYPDKSGVYPARKMVISVYKKKPSGEFEDACDYTSCRKN